MPVHKKPWVQPYLSLLGIAQQEPSYDFLQSICRAHLTTLAFENISKLIYDRDKTQNGYVIPPVEDLIRNYHRYHFGGTCYALNYNLYQLLQELGFACHLVSLSRVHMGIVVRVPDTDEPVYVDCGAAAPFFDPVRFATNPDNVSRFGHDEVLIRKDEASGLYHYARYMNGAPSGDVWTFAADKPAAFAEFDEAIGASNLPGSTFMSMLRCQLWQLDKGRSASLANNVLSFRYANGDVEKHVLTSVEEIETAIREEFGLPRLPVRDAVAILSDFGVDIFQPA